MTAYLLLLILLLPIAISMSTDSMEGIDQFNEKLAKIAPNMIYLGNFGYKGWYAFHDQVPQALARQNCLNFGMKLGIIDSQAELEFIANKATESYYHTDGRFQSKPSSFRWSTGLRELNPDLKIYQFPDGQRLVKATKKLGATWVVNPYLCFMSLSRSGHKVQREIKSEVIMESQTLSLTYDSAETVEKAGFTNQTIAGLTYVGKYGFKSFYYDNTLVDWPTAKANCGKMGFTFARFDTQDELEWIVPLLPNTTTDFVWTDGEIKQGSQYWYWFSNGNNLNAGIGMSDNPWGLVVARSHLSLKINYKNGPPHIFPYICFIVTTI